MTEKNVSPICIGLDNKDNIKELEHKIQMLEKDIDHMKKSMVTSETLHELEMKINAIENKLVEMSNNRSEDRLAISKLNNAVEELSGRMEEYLESNAKLLAGQMITDNKMGNVEHALSELASQMKEMNEKIEEANIFNQLKIIYNRSTLSKWMMRFAGVLLVIFIVAIFTFFTSGGESTFFDILENLKELIT